MAHRQALIGLLSSHRAILGNVSMEIMVDGTEGVTIQQPILLSPDTGQVLFDWRGNGWMGQNSDFDSANPHQGRLGPNADVGATVTMPSGSEITEFILEALACWPFYIP